MADTALRGEFFRFFSISTPPSTGWPAASLHGGADHVDRIFKGA
jgi:hypothetical protein